MAGKNFDLVSIVFDQLVTLRLLELGVSANGYYSIATCGDGRDSVYGRKVPSLMRKLCTRSDILSLCVEQAAVDGIKGEPTLFRVFLAELF